MKSNYQLNPLLEWVGHATAGILGGTMALGYKYGKQNQLRDNEIDNSEDKIVISIIKKYIPIVKQRLKDNIYYYQLIMKFRNNPTDENAIQLIKYCWGDEKDEILEKYRQSGYSNWLDYLVDCDCGDVKHPEFVQEYIENDKKLLYIVNESLRTNNIPQLKMIIKKYGLSNHNIDKKVESHWTQKIPGLAYYSGGALAGGIGYHYAKKGLKTLLKR